MSSRPPKKAALAPGQVVGRSPEQFFVNNSPQRKVGSKKGKRSAPQPKQLNPSAASFVPNASFHPGSSASGVKKTSRSYAATAWSTAGASSAAKKGVRVDESRNNVLEMTVGSDDDDENWENLVPSEDEAEAHIGDVDADDEAPAASSPEAVDEDGSEANSAVAAAATNGTKNTSDASAPSSGSSSEDEDDDEPPAMYADLARFDGSIRYRHDKVKDFWFADYCNLSVKERRELLKSRGQATSGPKATLGRRLEHGDMRRLNVLRIMNRLDKLQPHERHIEALLSRRSRSKEECGRRSTSSEPIGQSVLPGRSLSQPPLSRQGSAASEKTARHQESRNAACDEQQPNFVNVEESSDVEMEVRSKHSDADDLFGGSSPLESPLPAEVQQTYPPSSSPSNLRTPQPGDFSDGKKNQQPSQSLLLLPKQSPLPLLLSHLSPLCIPHPRLPVDY
jgi:hypothetical protein